MKIKQLLIVSGIVFQIAILSVTIYYLHDANKTSDPFYEPEILVNEEVVEKNSKVPFANYILGSGKVACSTISRVNPKKEGIVENLLVKEGDFVKMGDALFNIEKGMLTYALNEKKADYELCLAELKAHEKESPILSALIRKKEIVMQAAEKEIEDCKVVAPIDGRVLKVNINKGEYVDPTQSSLVIGSESPLHLKVVIDEKEMWKFSPSKNLRAVALHKTNPEIHFVLDFISIQPFAQNSNSEDGKLELLFSFDKGKAPLYLDQTLDVFIEAATEQERSYLNYRFNQN